MELLVTLSSIANLWLLFFVTGFLLVFTHELGHAACYLIFTRPESIDIYIGSYGNEKATTFKAGKLTFHFSFSFPFIILKGLCRSSKQETNYIKWIVILLAGSLSSLLISFIITWFVFYYDLHGSSKLFVVVFIGYSILIFFTNLLSPSPVSEENPHRSDGENILLALKLKDKLPLLTEIDKQIKNKDYVSATNNLEVVIEAVPNHIDYHRILVTTLFLLKDYDKAKNRLELIAKLFTLKSHDYLNYGYYYSVTKNRSLAIENYKLCLRYEPNNTICLNNIGLEMTEAGDFIKAEEYLNTAIKIHPNFGYAYNTLGYCKIMQNQLEEGKILLDKGMSIQTDSAYAHKALGLYYIKLGDAVEAQVQFNKAREIDSSIDLTV